MHCWTSHHLLATASRPVKNYIAVHRQSCTHGDATTTRQWAAEMSGGWHNAPLYIWPWGIRTLAGQHAPDRLSRFAHQQPQERPPMDEGRDVSAEALHKRSTEPLDEHGLLHQARRLELEGSDGYPDEENPLETTYMSLMQQIITWTAKLTGYSLQSLLAIGGPRHIDFCVAKPYAFRRAPYFSTKQSP